MNMAASKPKNRGQDRIEVFSFDIFDTVISRDGKKPVEVFEMIQRQLETSGSGFPEYFITNFASIREECERLARESSEKEDITFDELYDYIGSKHQLTRVQIEKLKRIELEAELDCAKPVEHIVSEVNSLRGKGKRIVFATEMYLPRAHIVKMLEKAGAYESGDGVYVSGEIGLLKYTGNLFRYMLEKEKCLPEHFCHFGDNVLVDMIVPYRMGISIYRTPELKIKIEIWKRAIKKFQNRLLFYAARVFRFFPPRQSRPR